MSLFSILILILVAAICGSIGAQLGGRSTRGCLTSIVVGFIGALIGTWVSNQIGIRDFFYIKGIPVFWSIFGSAVFVAIINLMTNKK